MDIFWSPRATRDLDAIHGYIANSSAMQAELVRDRLVAAVQRIAEFPQSGRIVPEVYDPNIREIIVRPYRIVYRLRAGAAEIVMIFRGSRRIPRDLT